MFQMLAEKVKLGSAAIAVATALGCASLAQAAQYTGRWDPAFGPAFPDLGWQGEATFFVPDACLSFSGLVTNFNSCASGEIKILGAEVDFYKLSDPTNPAFHETLVFGVPATGFFEVPGVILDDGQLLGVLGGFPYFVPSTLPLAGGPYSEFLLFFLGDIPVLISSKGDFSDFTSDDRPTVAFRLVPEPGALALLGLGLGMMGLMVRRRRVGQSTTASSRLPLSAAA